MGLGYGSMSPENVISRHRIPEDPNEHSPSMMAQFDTAVFVLSCTTGIDGVVGSMMSCGY